MAFLFLCDNGIIYVLYRLFGIKMEFILINRTNLRLFEQKCPYFVTVRPLCKRITKAEHPTQHFHKW